MTKPNRSRAAAFTRLVEQHRGILQKVARAYCPARDEQSDLVAEIAVALWRSFDRYDTSRSFATWAYRIALNVAISYYRRGVRHASRRAPLEHAPAAPDAAPGDPRVAALLECIGQLDPLDRALILMHLDGYAHAEVGDALGITATNVSTKLNRIKQRLRRTIAARKTEETNGTR